MIRFHLPAGSKTVYGVIQNAIVGPFAANNSNPNDTIITREFATDKLDQGGGIYGENAVYHNKADGDVYYVPYATDMVPAPTPTRPKAVTWLVSWFYPQVNDVKSLPYGPVSYGDYYCDPQTNATIHTTWTGSGTSMDCLTFVVNNDKPSKIVSASVYQVKDLKVEPSGVLSYSYRTVFYTANSVFPYEGGGSWTLARSSNDMLVAQGGMSVDYSDAWRSSTTRAYTTRTVASLSPSLALLEMSAFVFDKLNPPHWPEGDADYGDLAMDASSKVNANQVNMIAFIKDIRKPWELIPKLKNLNKLKTHAGNYLGFEYGILPTIDDIQSIIGACRRMKPYLDKNGFSIYTASHNSTTTINDTFFEVEQRIKLAIANEDNAFVELINKVDSMGFLPTLTNIWDLVPYSFVLDWFIDIGSLLERIDANVRLLRLPIRYVTMSRKGTASVDLLPTKDFPYSGSVKKVRYQRWVTDHCPEPPLSITPHTDFSHWLEAAALLIQRAKH